MKNYIYNIIPILLLITLGSCEKVFMEPNPETDNIAIFEEYWKILNEKYAMFEAKNIDRTKLYEGLRVLVDNKISSDSLFLILGGMTISLRDGHTVLIDPQKQVAAVYPLEEGFPKNLDQDLVDQIYLNEDVKMEGEGLKYRLLRDNIGYIQYRDYEDEVTTEMMDNILKEFSETKGIILDVRGNGGGDPSFAALMASHFTDSEVYIGYENFKTGPGIDDFSRSEIYLQPTEGIKYLKPLVVLTNRYCFSATTTLIYHLNPLPNVTFIGGRTGGGSGSVADGFLANGWQYSLSTSEFIDWEGTHLDEGFDPDIFVNTDTTDMSQDEIIERAILELE